MTEITIETPLSNSIYSIKFSNWILKDKTQSPNFFDAQRVHFIINKMIISSKKKKKIYIN